MSAVVPRELRRYLRQMRVAGVGLDGQRALVGARVALASPAASGASEVEREYLERAGVHVDPRADVLGGADVPLSLDDPSAQQALEGAYRALAAIRALLAPSHR